MTIEPLGISNVAFDKLTPSKTEPVIVTGIFHETITFLRLVYANAYESMTDMLGGIINADSFGQ